MDGTRIREITAAGLTYLTDNGSEAVIDFSVCYANYLREMTSPDYLEHVKRMNPFRRWDDAGIKAYIESQAAWREVAIRNVLSEPWGSGPYIEFRTEPPTRFKFESKHEFYRVRFEVEKFGWRTFDLS